MNKIDLECKLIAGKPVFIDNVPVYPIPLDTIFDIGYSTYNSILGEFCIDSETIYKLTNVEIDDNKIFDFLSDNCKVHDSILNDLLIYLTIVCRCDVKFDKFKGHFILSYDKTTAYINNENFLKIQKVIKQRNGIENIEEDIDNPANEMARQLLLKRSKFRKKINDIKARESDSSDISMADLVSILASGLHMEISQICKYDIYQFNNQFNRLKIFKDYEVNIQALLAGANSDDIKLKHWISKTSNNEDENE